MANRLIELEPSRAREMEFFAVPRLKTRFVHKTDPLYVETCVSRPSIGTRGFPPCEPHPPHRTAEQLAFLAELTPRQIEIAAAHLDGCTQEEIAEQLDVDQATVSRELQDVQRAAARHGGSLRKPPRVYGQRVIQLTDRMQRRLGI